MAFTEDRSVLSRTVAPPEASVSYGSLAEQMADVRFGDERAIHRPLVLIIHGGFWRPTIDRTHTGPMAVNLASEGWTVAAIEYRRVPGQPDATIDDVREAIVSLPEKIAKHDGRVLVMGHSAGGHLTLWAASARPTEKLIGALALGPAADLRLAHSRSSSARTSIRSGCPHRRSRPPSCTAFRTRSFRSHWPSRTPRAIRR
jgi:acetyl esterase/lipase